MGASHVRRRVWPDVTGLLDLAPAAGRNGRPPLERRRSLHRSPGSSPGGAISRRRGPLEPHR